MSAEPENRSPMSTERLVQDGLAAALELPGVLVVLVDLQGRIVYWNTAASRLCQWPAAEVVGRAFIELLPEREHGTWRKLIGKLSRGRHVPPLQTHVVCADDSRIDVLLSAVAFDNEQGERSGYALGLQDVTRVNLEIARAQRSSAEVQSVVQTVLDGVIGISASGIIEAFNPAAERLFGYRAHEVIGRNVSLLMPEPHRSAHDRYLKHYLDTGQARIVGIGREVTAQRRDGEVFPAELSVSELRLSDEHCSFVGVVRDITERKQAESRLKSLNSALNDKVEELHETLTRLRQAQKQLVQSEKMASLGALVAGVAHEINTPIGVCVSASSLLDAATREIDQKLQVGKLARSEFDHFIEQAREATDLINRNIARAADLVSAFKQTAVDRSQEATREIDLAAYLHEIVLSLTPFWRRAGHRIRIECASELCLYTDAGALAQVVTNLISNAVTHAFDEGQAGEIRLDAVVADGQTELRISDNGRGIALPDLEKIFEPFFTTARGKGGTGLGLHISYNLVTQALRGRLDVESVVGQGTTFVLHFPQRLDIAGAEAKDGAQAATPLATPKAE